MLRTAFQPIPLTFPKCIPQHYTNQVGLVHQVLTQEEQTWLVHVCRLKLRGTSFLNAHFDGVIQGYRERTVSNWEIGVDARQRKENQAKTKALIHRCQSILESVIQAKLSWLPEHVLELNEHGTIEPHIDHLTASGRVVGALSLISSTPIVFTHKDNPSWTFQLLSEPGSLYYQFDQVRYDFKHSIPKPLGQPRLSIMFRDRPS